MPPEPPLLLRADSDPRIATGHVLRCLALAQAWRALGGSAVLLSRCDSPDLRARVLAGGIGFAELRAPHPDPADLDATLRALERLKRGSLRRPWLVADGYHFDETFQKRTRAAGARLLVVDDHLHLLRYHADILLNQSLHAETLAYPVNPDALQLLGPTFALLRPEFLAAKPRDETPEVARRILVTLGGGDVDNVTLNALRAIQALEIPGAEAVVVVGASNPHYGALQDAIARGRTAVRLLRNPPNMPELMAWADAAVGAGGGTAWEFAYMGLPSVVLALAENQRGVAAGLESAGVAASLGDAAAVSVDALQDALATLCGDADRRRRFAENGRKFVDGRGAQRVARIMLALEGAPLDGAVEIRQARASDAYAVWRIANDPSVRANSFHGDPIPIQRHRDWYAAQLRSRDTRFWVLTLADAVVGQVRYARAGNGRSRGAVAEVHFSIAAAMRGKGLGTLALRRTAPFALRELEVSRVRGVVLPPNEASMRAFLRAGFQRLSDVEERGRVCWRFELERLQRSLAS